MIHPSPAELDAADPATAFLSLRWNEFFDRYTVDSYQPKLCNLPTLVEEIQGVCLRQKRHKSAPAQLHALQQELASHIDSALSHGWINHFDRWQLDELRKAKACSESLDLAQVLIGGGFRERFEGGVFAVNGEISSMLPHKKHLADAWLGQLATIALQRGYSTDEAHGDFSHFLAKPPKSWMEGLLARLQSRPQEYLVFIELLPTAECSLEKLAKVMKKAGFKVEDPTQFPQITIAAGAVLLSKCEIGVSPVVVLRSVLRWTEPILDMLAFYLADRAATLPARGWVGKTPDSLVETELQSQSLRLVHAHKKADQLVIHALKANSGSRFDGSVSNALELHSTAMRASDVRTRFLNLWGALECLASVIDTEGICKRVQQLVCPIVSWRKIEKVGRYTAINLHLWRSASDQLANIPAALPGSTQRRVSAGEMISVLCKANNHPDIIEVLSICGNHSLLRHRIYSAWQEFHDPRVLAKSIAASRERLGWHIGRIYRARNLLVHEGIESPRLESLCDNLHYYVSSVLSRVIHGLSQHDQWQPGEAAKYWCMTGDFVLDSLKHQSQVITLENLMPNVSTKLSQVMPWSDFTAKPSVTVEEEGSAEFGASETQPSPVTSVLDITS